MGPLNFHSTYCRNLEDSAHCFSCQIAALVTGLIFLRQAYNQKAIMNLNGALFIMLVQVSYTNCLAVLNVGVALWNLHCARRSECMWNDDQSKTKVSNLNQNWFVVTFPPCRHSHWSFQCTRGNTAMACIGPASISSARALLSCQYSWFCHSCTRPLFIGW